MTANTAWLLDSGQSRQDTRLAPLGTFTPTSPMAARSGVIPGSSEGKYVISGLTVTGTASASMTATVSPGRAVIQGSDGQGAYPVAFSSTTSLQFDPADAQDRIDLVVVQITDNTGAAIVILKGQPAAAPVPKALPALALPLYQVSVKAATNAITWASSLTDVRTATVAAGGILPASDSAPGAYPGQYRDNNGRLERWNNQSWQLYPAVPTWKSWTPAWTTTKGSTTSFGTGATITCRYVQSGLTVHFTFFVAFGSGAAFGTTDTGDNWQFSLPVPAANPGGSNGTPIGFLDLAASNALHAIGRMQCVSSTAFQLEIASGTPGGGAIGSQGTVDATSPWTWAAKDTLMGTGTYEALAA
jgi:hypothetical protein